MKRKPKNKVLTRDEILVADDLPSEEINIPEWGGMVHVRTLTGTERDAFEQQGLGGDGANYRARLAVASVVDDKGGQLFKATDAEALGAKSSKALDKVFDVACRLNGFGLAAVEDLEKN